MAAHNLYGTANLPRTELVAIRNARRRWPRSSSASAQAGSTRSATSHSTRAARLRLRAAYPDDLAQIRFLLDRADPPAARTKLATGYLAGLSTAQDDDGLLAGAERSLALRSALDREIRVDRDRGAAQSDESDSRAPAHDVHVVRVGAVPRCDWARWTGRRRPERGAVGRQRPGVTGRVSIRSRHGLDSHASLRFARHPRAEV